MRVLPIIVVGSSVLSTSFAQQQQYRSHSSSMRMCSTADQRACCGMVLDNLEEARNYCIERGCNQNICYGKPSGAGVGAKKDDSYEDYDHVNDVDLWGSGGVTQWGEDKDEDDYDYDASSVDKWSKDEVDSDASAILPSRSRQRQQRGLAWSPPNWGAPKYTEPKPYYSPPANNYYPPSAPTPYYYYPAAPEFVETCCSSNERVCPMDFPMQKQVFLSGKLRVCCFTRRVDGGGGSYGGGGYYPGPGYGGGGYQYQTRAPRNGYGYGYGNRKLQYGYGRGGSYTYGQQPSYYGDSYANANGLPAQCPANQITPSPTKSPTKAPTKVPTSEPSLEPSSSSQPSSGPSVSQMPSSEPSNMPSPAPKATITDVDPLDPNDLDVDFQFGKSVAISGTSALIGAPFAIDNGKTTGAAYLFESLTGSAKKTVLPLTQPDESYAECGASVALSNEYAVIGCPGFKESPGGTKTGAVVIYTRGSTVARRITYQGSGSDAAEFGTSVSVNAAGILAVGSNKGSVELFNLSNTPPSPIPITSTLGNDFDTTSVALNDNWPPLLAVGAIKAAGDRSGSVFLYTDVTNEDAVPEEISAPTDANCASGCLFGFSVALSGNTLVVGSPETQSNAGRAFVYNDVVNFKDQVQPLPTPTESPPPANALFGSSVAIAGGAVVVGSPKYSIGSNGAIEIRGAAFFYNKNIEGFWYLPDFDSISKEEQNPILGGTQGEQFGKAVAISNEAFVVGAPFHSDSKGKAVAYSYISATNP